MLIKKFETTRTPFQKGWNHYLDKKSYFIDKNKDIHFESASKEETSNKLWNAGYILCFLLCSKNKNN